MSAKSDRTIDPTRRTLCQAMCAASGLVMLRTLPGCGGGDTQMASCASSAIGVGDAAAIGVGQATYMQSQGLFVCRDEQGYYAMDAACTHIGTNLNFQDAKTGFKCPLHFSTFDFNGHVLSGPAKTDLAHYELCTTESGILIVDLSKHVTPDTRLVI